jgi:hypothetical protein
VNTPIPINSTNAAEVAALARRLADPFDPREIKFKPQMVKGNKALAIAYLDVRLVEDRLDEVVGAEGWQDDYEILPDGSVTCKLRVKLGGEWVTKMDVGSPSEQPDGGDRMKAAFSDALKRTAIKFGIGRYLYRLPAQWVDYDPAKKQIVRAPQLPAFALPAGYTAPPARASSPPPASPPPPAAAANGQAKGNPLPANGRELHDRLQNRDAYLAGQKACVRGALLAHVTRDGVKVGYPANLTEWTGPAIEFAVKAVREFEASLKQPAGGR